MVWLLGAVLRGTQAACSSGECAVLGYTTPAPQNSLLPEPRSCTARSPVVRLVLITKTAQPRISWEESFKEELSISDGALGVSTRGAVLWGCCHL